MVLELQCPAVFGDGADNSLWYSPGNIGFDFQGHLNICSYKTRQMSDHFFGYSARITSDASGIQRDSSMKATRYLGRSFTRLAPRLSLASRAWLTGVNISTAVGVAPEEGAGFSASICRSATLGFTSSPALSADSDICCPPRSPR